AYALLRSERVPDEIDLGPGVAAHQSRYDDRRPLGYWLGLAHGWVSSDRLTGRLATGPVSDCGRRAPEDNSAKSMQRPARPMPPNPILTTTSRAVKTIRNPTTCFLSWPSCQWALVHRAARLSSARKRVTTTHTPVSLDLTGRAGILLSERAHTST